MKGMQKYKAPPGTHDVFPGAAKWEDNSAKWNEIETAFRELCRIYGYGEIKTPIFEPTELFTRAVGEGTDIVGKEMYTFTDRGDRSMTLRPEGTAPAIRAYLENGIYAECGVSKLYYIGPIFRYERNQKGRYRQHSQCGIEALGSVEPDLDAEVIQFALAFYQKIGINRLNLKINSVGCPKCRPSYRDALIDFARPVLGQMSEDNRRRFDENPLRMLDSKDANDQALLKDAPILTDFLCEECASHFAAVRLLLDTLNVPWDLDPRLVRGFDYYTKTAFEIQSPDLGAQATLCGGGRYDGLVEELGGSPTPGIGFGLGIERALIALQALSNGVSPRTGKSSFIVTLGDRARQERPLLLAKLRNASVAVDTDYSGKSMKAQMRAADRSGARFAIILGDNELERSTAQVKDLSSGEQTEVEIDKLADTLLSV
jgi:histidyl-tRNA synthetase